MKENSLLSYSIIIWQKIQQAYKTHVWRIFNSIGSTVDKISSWDKNFIIIIASVYTSSHIIVHLCLEQFYQETSVILWEKVRKKEERKEEERKEKRGKEEGRRGKTTPKW